MPYSRFQDYLDNWFDATGQMNCTTVINTDLPQGVKQFTSNISYLDQNFFDSLKKKPAKKDGKGSEDGDDDF